MRLLARDRRLGKGRYVSDGGAKACRCRWAFVEVFRPEVRLAER